jgi:hypothetical protein
MQLEYACNECGREISSSEFEAQSDIFCPECGGHLEENTTASTEIDKVESSPSLFTCEKCKHKFSGRAPKCPRCAWVPTAICGICQSNIPFDSNACPECGDPAPFSVQGHSQKLSQVTDQVPNNQPVEMATKNPDAPVLGIVSTGLGIGAILMPYFAAVFLAPAAIIIGILAFRKNQKSLGFIGMLLGIVGIIFIIYTSNQITKITSQLGGKSGEILMSESLAGPQNNAVRSAKQYLSMQGFSRSGLIDQLSSDYGSGYNIADATAAVDSLNIDWNNQAVRSAKQYLSMQGFSCKGLIEQLSSSAGDKYTVSQATYGARQAGACQ